MRPLRKRLLIRSVLVAPLDRHAIMRMKVLGSYVEVGLEGRLWAPSVCYQSIGVAWLLCMYGSGAGGWN